MKTADPKSPPLIPPCKGGKTGWIAGGSFLVIALAVYIFFYWIPYGGIATPATETKAVVYVKQLLLGCRAYADDHEGAYPPNLGLLYPDNIEAPEIFFSEDSQGNDIPILYYAGFTRTSDPEAVLIEHPVSYRGNRIVGTVGGLILRVPID